MLEVQTSIDSTVTYFSLLVAVGYSTGVSLFAIALTSVAGDLRTIFLTSASILVLVAIVSTIILNILQIYTMPHKIARAKDGLYSALCSPISHTLH
jgi:uncharacterized membrane protein YcgQ (UPF0703/DUF1980 family)